MMYVFRVPSDRKVHPPEVQVSRGRRPPARRRPQGGSHGGRVDGGGGAPVPPGAVAGGVRVPHLPGDARRPHQPQGRGREPGEARQGARRLRGAPVQARLPGRGLRQRRGPQSLPVHLLLHGDAARVALRLVPARQGVVAEARGEAVHEEARRHHGCCCRYQAGLIERTGKRPLPISVLCCVARS